MTGFRMEFETKLTEQECRDIIDRENLKDKSEADMIVKIMEGRTGELSYVRRKVAGQILHNMQKVIMKQEQRDWILANLKERALKGSEQFVEWKDGKLTVEFDEFGRMGSDFLKRTKKAEKNLMKRFNSTFFRYVDSPNPDKALQELRNNINNNTNGDTNDNESQAAA